MAVFSYPMSNCVRSDVIQSTTCRHAEPSESLRTPSEHLFVAWRAPHKFFNYPSKRRRPHGDRMETAGLWLVRLLHNFRNLTFPVSFPHLTTKLYIKKLKYLKVLAVCPAITFSPWTKWRTFGRRSKEYLYNSSNTKIPTDRHPPTDGELLKVHDCFEATAWPVVEA